MANTRESTLRARTQQTMPVAAKITDEALPEASPISQADHESRNISRVFVQIIYAGSLFALMAGGLLYASFQFDAQDSVVRARTPASTTELHAKLPSYFADKRNLLNQIFVKKAWGWTTIAFILTLVARPRNQSPAHLVKPVIRYLLATAYWILFTAWFFGPSIADRLLILSGAKCLPASFLSNQSLSPAGVDSALLDPTLCISGAQARKAMQRSTAESVVAGQGLEGILGSRPYWYGGHDVSGHTFLLVHASLFLAAEIAPLTPLLLGTRQQKALVEHWQRLAVTGAIATNALWAVMLFFTSVYFHSPLEKFTGFFIGTLGAVISQYIVGT